MVLVCVFKVEVSNIHQFPKTLVLNLHMAEGFGTGWLPRTRTGGCKAEDLLIQIQRATEIESRHIEDQR